MIIFLKNKHTLQIDNFNFRCCIGKNGLTTKKIEGDKKTPKGTFKIEHLYYRKDRINIPKTNLKSIQINSKMGWSNDTSNYRLYNRLININQNVRHEKIHRRDYKYDLLIPIKYNFDKKILGKGSCIFVHLTKNYQPTAGCVALKLKDFLIMLKIIKKSSKIRIY